MAIVKDEEQQQGQGTSQALGQGMAGQQPQQPQQPQDQQPQQGSSGPATIGASQPSQPSMPMPKQPKAGTGTFANLKNYLQAAQGGGQQRVAQAATQQVQKLGAGAQKGTQQAQEAFGRQMAAGSLKGMETAAEEARGIIGTARAATYQAPKQVSPQSISPQTVQPRTQPQAEGQAPEAPTPAAPAPEQPQAPAQQYFSPEQQQRFAEIINAQYQGPASLQQAGLYEQAAQKARTAQEAAQKTQTALGREQLLRDVFGRTREYGRGVSKLDALLLNASQEGVKKLQEQAQPATKAQEALQAAQNLSTNEAAQRKAAIEGIRSGAREEFTQARTAEEQAVENRIDSLIKTPAKDEKGNPIPKLDSTGKPIVDAAGNPVYQTEWDRLPEYFRQSLANKGTANKQIQEEGIKALEESTGLSTKRFNELPGQIAALKQTIERLREQERVHGPDIFRKSLSIKAREQLKNATERLNALKSEYASYSDFGNQLKGIQSMNQNQWVLSPEEAAILGVSAGEGLYNIRPEDIKAAQADRARLITKDELARQQALAQLAEQDAARQLQKDLLYTDMSKAGTQDLRSSLDTESLRRLLNESQKGFKEAAEAANLTGTGSKKVSRGNLFGKKTKTYTASVEGNVADMLRQAGYDVGAEDTEGAKSLLTDRDLLNRFLGATSTSRATDAQAGGQALEGTAAGASTGASIGAVTGAGPMGALAGAGVGGMAGGMAGANTLDQIQYYSDLAKEMEDKLGIKGLGAAGQAVQDVRSGAGGIFTGAGNIAGNNVVGDIFRGLGGAISGIDTGAMRKLGESTARQFAIQDLQNKYAQFLQGQGFENRANIANTETTRARTAALMDLLRRQG